MSCISLSLKKAPLTENRCGGLSILHNHYVHDYVFNNQSGLRVIPVLNIMQVELCWSMISAMIPNLKAFIRSFNSGFGLGFDLDAMTNKYGSGKQSAQRTADYELSQMKSSHSAHPSRSGVTHSQHDIEEARPRTQDIDENPITTSNYRAGATSTHEVEGDSVNSVGSQDQIIRKDIQWQVSYEEAHAR